MRSDIGGDSKGRRHTCGGEAESESDEPQTSGDFER